MQATVKQNAYAVTLIFGDGPIVANVILASTPEAATAVLLCEFVRGAGGLPENALTGLAVCPISLEWLRAAERAMAGTTGTGKRVVPLGLVHVAAAAAAPDATPPKEARQWPPRPAMFGPTGAQICRRHGIVLDTWGQCPACAAEDDDSAAAAAAAASEPE